MTSERQIAANRLNGRKSRGPRTTAGSCAASRNALRHGLAAIGRRQPIETADLERLAKALCRNDDDPTLYKQAVVIASHELVLRAISAQQIAVVERLRDMAQAFIGFAGLMGDRAFAFVRTPGPKGFPWHTGREQEDLVLFRPHFREGSAAILPPDIEETFKMSPG